jgi:hypothetical protein
MDGACRKFEMCGAMVGGEFNCDTAFGKRGCQCLGGKQMTAGPTGCEQDDIFFCVSPRHCLSSVMPGPVPGIHVFLSYT